MSIDSGTRIGVYEVIAAIGAGGMGEVYRRDTRLNRDVALKILPGVFAAVPERLARFEREAQVLASLNHPHIAQIYGIEEGPPEGGPHDAGVGGPHDAGVGGRHEAGVGAAFRRPVRALVMERRSG